MRKEPAARLRSVVGSPIEADRRRSPRADCSTPAPQDDLHEPRETFGVGQRLPQRYRGRDSNPHELSPPDFESNGAGSRRFPAEAYTAGHSRISAVTSGESLISQRPYWSLSYPRCTSKVLPKVLPSLSALRVRRHEPLQLVEPVGDPVMGRSRSGFEHEQSLAADRETRDPQRLLLGLNLVQISGHEETGELRHGVRLVLDRSLFQRSIPVADVQ